MPAQGSTHSDGGASSSSGYHFTSLTSTAAQQDSANELWEMYLDEVKEDDKRISDAWKENSNGILVFVSPTLVLILMFVSIASFKTGLFSATVGIYHRILQNVVPRFRRSNSGSSWANFKATC
jgi:hypothetical protein